VPVALAKVISKLVYPLPLFSMITSSTSPAAFMYGVATNPVPSPIAETVVCMFEEYAVPSSSISTV